MSLFNWMNKTDRSIVYTTSWNDINMIHTEQLQVKLLSAPTLFKPIKVEVTLTGYVDAHPDGQNEIKEFHVSERHELHETQVLMVDITPVISIVKGQSAVLPFTHTLVLNFNPWQWGPQTLYFKSRDAEMQTLKCNLSK